MNDTWNLKEFEFDKTCEICCMTYDPIQRIPKILPCCKKTYCFDCIKQNVEKFKKCINCRNDYIYGDHDLITDENVFQLICPFCKVETERIKLRINTMYSNFGTVMCDSCQENEPCIENFFEFINLLNEELRDFDDKKIQLPENFEKNFVLNFEKKFKEIIDVLNQKLLKNFKEHITLIVKDKCVDYSTNYELYKQLIDIKTNLTQAINQKRNKDIDFKIIKDYLAFYFYNKNKIVEAYKNLLKLEFITFKTGINNTVTLDILSRQILSKFEVKVDMDNFKLKDFDSVFSIIDLFNDENEKEEYLRDKIKLLRKEFEIKSIRKIIDEMEGKKINKVWEIENLLTNNEINFSLIQNKYTKPKFINQTDKEIILIKPDYKFSIETNLDKFNEIVSENTNKRFENKPREIPNFDLVSINQKDNFCEEEIKRDNQMNRFDNLGPQQLNEQILKGDNIKKRNLLKNNLNNYESNQRNFNDECSSFRGNFNFNNVLTRNFQSTKNLMNETSPNMPNFENFTNFEPEQDNNNLFTKIPNTKFKPNFKTEFQQVKTNINLKPSTKHPSNPINEMVNSKSNLNVSKYLKKK